MTVNLSRPFQEFTLTDWSAAQLFKQELSIGKIARPLPIRYSPETLAYVDIPQTSNSVTIDYAVIGGKLKKNVRRNSFSAAALCLPSLGRRMSEKRGIGITSKTIDISPLQQCVLSELVTN